MASIDFNSQNSIKMAYIWYLDTESINILYDPPFQGKKYIFDLTNFYGKLRRGQHIMNNLLKKVLAWVYTTPHTYSNRQPEIQTQFIISFLNIAQTYRKKVGIEIKKNDSNEWTKWMRVVQRWTFCKDSFQTLDRHLNESRKWDRKIGHHRQSNSPCPKPKPEHVLSMQIYRKLGKTGYPIFCQPRPLNPGYCIRNIGSVAVPKFSIYLSYVPKCLIPIRIRVRGSLQYFIFVHVNRPVQNAGVAQFGMYFPPDAMYLLMPVYLFRDFTSSTFCFLFCVCVCLCVFLLHFSFVCFPFFLNGKLWCCAQVNVFIPNLCVITDVLYLESDHVLYAVLCRSAVFYVYKCTLSRVGTGWVSGISSLFFFCWCRCWSWLKFCWYEELRNCQGV